ncbi:MAG: glycosyltransferase family 2 protein [Halanaerobiales bacterium]
MSELISVIVPVYKVEDYLQQCIDSLRNQTYENLEIILVDDGSPDKCGEICDHYAEVDDRVKVIHKENGGVSRARNAGLEIAEGEYISFLDSDDWVEPDYINILYKLLKNHNVDISICNYVKTDGDDVSLVKSKGDTYIYSGIEALNGLYGEDMIQMNVCWGKLFKKSLFLYNKFPDGKIFEDILIMHNLYYDSEKIIVTTQELVYYRQREKSFTKKRHTIKMKLDMLEAFKERKNFFQSKRLSELAKVTWKNYLYFLPEIYENKSENEFAKYKDQIMGELQCAREILGKYDFGFKIRSFYKLFFIMPGLMSRLFRLYRKIYRW